MKQLIQYLSFTLVLFTGTAAMNVHAADRDITASWQSHQVKFRYAGFTTDYSCDGIRSKVKSLLRAMGARDDVKVESRCSGPFTKVQPFHNLKLAFALPVPAEETAVDEQVFKARWEELRVGYNRPLNFDGGDCELLEQFSDQVLSSLNLKNLEDNTRCIPHQRSPGALDLKVSVLVKQDEAPLEP